MDKEKFKNLIDKYIAGTATDGEKEVINSFLDSYADENTEWQENIMGDPQEAEAEILQNICSKTDGKVPGNNISRKKNKIRFRIVWSAAAILLIPVVIGYYFFRSEPSVKPIEPGSDKAMLTLADGSVIVLNDMNNDTLTSQGNTFIVQNDAQLICNPQGETKDHARENMINTVSTPRGGQFQVTLPDGSKVWLNAASSIKFPTMFSEKERRVEITGEVYFEVVPRINQQQKAKIPFVVIAEGVRIDVLGTHFNVDAYKDDNTIRTTLFEGSVEVTALETGESQIVSPGQQARTSENGKIEVKSIDLNEVIAWKEGMFFFNDTGIEQIMNSISRWYDVDVLYEGDVRELRFVGITSRKENIKEILDIMAITDVVSFEIQGRTIIVKRGKEPK
jgi:hypothetical protein